MSKATLLEIKAIEERSNAIISESRSPTPQEVEVFKTDLSKARRHFETFKMKSIEYTTGVNDKLTGEFLIVTRPKAEKEFFNAYERLVEFISKHQGDASGSSFESCEQHDDKDKDGSASGGGPHSDQEFIKGLGGDQQVQMDQDAMKEETNHGGKLPPCNQVTYQTVMADLTRPGRGQGASTISSGSSVLSGRQDQLAIAKRARKKAERDAEQKRERAKMKLMIAEMEAKRHIEDATDEEELAKELLHNAMQEAGMLENDTRRPVAVDGIAQHVFENNTSFQARPGYCPPPVHDAGNQLQLLSSVVTQQCLDAVHVEQFDGEPMDFARWANDIQVRIECYSNDPRRLMNKMQQTLSPRVKDQVFPTIVDGSWEQYRGTKARIRELYGMPDIIVQRFVDLLRKSKRIASEYDVAELSKFEVRLRKVGESLTALARLEEHTAAT